MESGKRIAFDYGEIRIGVAVSDQEAILAAPLTTLKNDPVTLQRELAELFYDIAPIYVYIGWPIHLSGNSNASSEKVRFFGEMLRDNFGLQIFLIDERFSTTKAEKQLQALNKSPSRNRDVIDQFAAANILEFALQVEKSQGKPAGLKI